MYEKELQRILDASQNNALTFFVGAGVSALSGGPTWKELIIAISEKLGQEPKKEFSSDEYLKIPQMLYYSLKKNDEEYCKFVEAQLHSSGLIPNQIHREMLNLNPVSFITTNYDTLLEDAVIQQCQSFKVVSRDEDVPTIFGDRFILKMHGDFKYNNFVLKEEDYLNYSENFKLIETLVKSIFATNTVVFIGYSLNDYNIKLILNWTKTLLKNSFRQPIFFHVGDYPLTETEIIYQQSRGLKVIEWSKIIDSTDGYLGRYQSLFSALKNQSKLSLEGKTEDEAFEILYDLLHPLNRLEALRIEDVSKRLYPYVYIDGSGVIHSGQNNNLLLMKFLSINKLIENERNSLEKDILEKYYGILEVFRKARILAIQDWHETWKLINEEVPFADKNCILFDYAAMRKYSSKTYETLEEKYKKAFYLSRMKRYDESFFQFAEVAKQAFNQKDYLIYYLAETNCISLSKVIENINKWYGCYDIASIKALSPSDSEIDNLFQRLPVEFRNTYYSLTDIHSVNMLYKYSYMAFSDGQKLQRAVERGSAESGLTSSRKATSRINDYLHFLLGNGIVADVFLEYRTSVKNLMSLLVYKYSTQEKEILHEQLVPFVNQDEVYFDEIDFHCFIEYFDEKEIIELLNKYQVRTIEFQNMHLVEVTVCNLLDYYRYITRYSNNKVEVDEIQLQIKNCLALFRFVNISQKLVDTICSFILTREFGKIQISDKVLFLDHQLARRQMNSKITDKVIEDTLISYLDKHIAALLKGENFEVCSATPSINYCNLVNYIFSQEEHISRRLSTRISQIIDNNLTQMYGQIINFYCLHVSNYLRKKLITWANGMLREDFDFDIFKLIIQCKGSINRTVKNHLKAFLKEKIDESKNDDSGDIYIITNSPFEELDQVGYWCLIGVLKAKDFSEFLGYSARFDFFYEPSKFDFSRFEVSWLLRLYPHTLEQISKDPGVKEHVRIAIADTLVNREIVSLDSQRLQNILVKYFC